MVDCKDSNLAGNLASIHSFLELFYTFLDIDADLSCLQIIDLISENQTWIIHLLISKLLFLFLNRVKPLPTEWERIEKEYLKKALSSISSKYINPLKHSFFDKLPLYDKIHLISILCDLTVEHSNSLHNYISKNTIRITPLLVEKDSSYYQFGNSARLYKSSLMKCVIIANSINEIEKLLKTDIKSKRSKKVLQNFIDYLYDIELENERKKKRLKFSGIDIGNIVQGKRETKAVNYDYSYDDYDDENDYYESISSEIFSPSIIQDEDTYEDEDIYEDEESDTSSNIEQERQYSNNTESEDPKLSCSLLLEKK